MLQGAFEKLDSLISNRRCNVFSTNAVSSTLVLFLCKIAKAFRVNLRSGIRERTSASCKGNVFPRVGFAHAQPRSAHILGYDGPSPSNLEIVARLSDPRWSSWPCTELGPSAAVASRGRGLFLMTRSTPIVDSYGVSLRRSAKARHFIQTSMSQYGKGGCVHRPSRAGRARPS